MHSKLRFRKCVRVMLGNVANMGSKGLPKQLLQLRFPAPAQFQLHAVGQNDDEITTELLAQLPYAIQVDDGRFWHPSPEPVPRAQDSYEPAKSGHWDTPNTVFIPA